MSKALIQFTLGVLIAHGAQAEVIRCKGDRGEFLLALTGDTGTVFQDQEGRFVDMKGLVKVTCSIDGGPLVVELFSDPLKVNWENQERCYVLGQNNLAFSIKVNQESQLRSLPGVLVDPKRAQNCSLPRVMISSPRPLTCQFVN